MKRFLKIVGGIVLLVLLAAGGFAAFIAIDGIPNYPIQKVDLKVEITPERVARGKVISNLLCQECHLNLANGKLTGHRLADLPPNFGRAYSQNITQDKQYGIGDWTDGEIAYLLRTGIKKNGQYSPPWMVKLPRIADEDIYSIIAYLRSDDSAVQALAIPDTAQQPSFLAKFLSHIAFKPFPYPDRKIVAPDIADKVVYGKYLVQDLVGCYGCHSADFKTLNEVVPEKSGGYLGGGNQMTGLDGQIIYTTNLTPDKETGIGNWTEEDFLKTMKMGVNPQGKTFRYPMTRTPEFSDDEIRAIYAYLRTVPVIHNPVTRNFPDLDGPVLSDGKAIYHKYGCNGCHGETGIGTGDLTKAKVDFPADSSLQAWIMNASSIKPMTKMPTFAGIIKDEEYAPLIAYVRELAK